MRLFEKVYIPDWNAKNSDYKLERTVKTILAGEARTAHLPLVEKENVIVLTPDELLDLMQEAIEHSYPTLLRESAAKLLIAKGIQITQ